MGNVEWEQTFGGNYQNSWGIAKTYSDSLIILAYGNAVTPESTQVFREFNLVLLNQNGELINTLYVSEQKNSFNPLDLKIIGEDVYCLFHQYNLPPIDPNSVYESRLLKYNMNTGLVWERAYRGFVSNQIELSLMDLEIIENAGEITFLMAGFLYDFSLIGSLLQCTWFMGADCEGYSVYPELNISSELIDEGSPGDIIFENTGTQVNELNWWFSTGESSNLQSPELTFENNGGYQVELSTLLWRDH